MLGDDIPQEFAPRDAKGALFYVQLDVEVSEVSKGFFQVCDEVATLPGLYDNAINIDFQVAPNLSSKTELLTLLVGTPTFFSPNGIFT
jgi:hypothetical protein